MIFTDTDVLVVGAGTTGLALALQAHDHGARVRVLERRRDCFRPSRALIVHPRTLEVLRPLGVTDALLARGDRAPSVRLHLRRRVVRADLDDLPLSDTAFPHLLIVAQASVEAVLAEALAARGVEVERQAEVIDLRPERDGTVARVRRATADELVRCRYVAGCDGPGSIVRRAAGMGWPGGAYHQEVVLADLELDAELAAGVAHAVAGRNGVLFLFALGERATWRLLVTRPTWGSDMEAGQPDGPVPIEDLQALIDGAGLPARVADVAWSARVPLEHRIATAYRSGPLFVVGDAAHVHSPAGGQGMNTGIQDAANLGWKLAFAASNTAIGNRSPETLLDSYETERRPVARRTVGLTHLLFWVEAGSGPAASFVRRFLVPSAGPAVPFLLRRRHLMAAGIRILSQLNVRYLTSPLSVEGRPRRRPGSRPGERLPDAPVTMDGRRRRLHELLVRPGVHLLFDRDAPSFDPEPLGPYIHVHRIDDWGGRGVVAVRPDGYVGFCAGVTDTEQLHGWLGMITTRLLKPSPAAAIVNQRISDARASRPA